MIKHTVKQRQRNHSGFSLVEVGLALMVIVVGILSAFALFPAGLEMVDDAVHKTRAAEFAKSAFNGYRAAAEDLTTDKQWRDFPETPGGALITPALYPPWSWSDPDEFDAEPTGDIETIRYTQVNFANTDADEIEQYALRYRFRIVDETENSKRMELWVWPGEFGSTDDELAEYFYTEIYRMKQ